MLWLKKYRKLVFEKTYFKVRSGTNGLIKGCVAVQIISKGYKCKMEKVYKTYFYTVFHTIYRNWMLRFKKFTSKMKKKISLYKRLCWETNHNCMPNFNSCLFSITKGPTSQLINQLCLYHRRRMETESKAKCRRFGMGGKIECRTENFGVIM